jgi:ABC-type glycerol-3-phosphate transport system permease component
MNEAKRIAKRATFLTGLVLSLAYVIPFLLVFLNAFKPKIDILMNPLAWPKTFTMDNLLPLTDKLCDYHRLCS